MLDNKRAQIGETMTWVIATLVIVVILSISILFTIPLGSDKQIRIEDKEKDFLATKSVTSFLSKKENIDLLDSKDNRLFYDKLKVLLEGMGVNPVKSFLEGKKITYISGKEGGGWNFEIDDGDKKIQVITSAVYTKLGDTPFSSRSEPFFEIKLKYVEKNLRFWAECSGGKCK